MTIAAIKEEISKRLREVRSDSLEFSDSEHFPDLRGLTADALGDVAMCTTAEELESINGLLERIEACWNLCKSDITGEESSDVLFEFDFVLDDSYSEGDEGGEEDEDIDEDEDDDDRDEGDEPPEDAPKRRYDISGDIKSLENWYDKLEGQGAPIHDSQLKLYFRRSVADLEAVEDRPALAVARNRYHKRFTRLDKRIRRYNGMCDAKPFFDSTHKAESLKKPNTVRVIVGCIALLTALGYGIITAISEERFVFLWYDWVYGLAGAGISYLLLSLVYAVCAKVNGASAVRRLSVTRLILIPFAAIGSLVLGLTVPQVGLHGAYIATLPFTLGGLGIYIVYRIKLSKAFRKKRKESKKRSK